MRKQYEEFTAAEGYVIGFHYGEDVYYIELDRIPRRYTRIQKESKSNGGGYGLYVKITEPKIMAEILPKAKHIGKFVDLIDTEGHLDKKGNRKFFNAGVMFEKMFYEANGQVFRGKDNVPFYQSGDITINGKEIQVKYEWARICYDKTLRKLSK
jgi:hypothetical protein